MKAKRLFLVLGAVLLALPAGAATKDVVLPAGTLLTCTMSEPNFSSKTVTTGDPFLCHPRTMQMFGQSVFPRGAYLVGHLQDTKDPGHFVGKGWLELAFDRIGLPDTDVPLSAKVIAVRGYRVDREGRIIGHGHATRDTIEWMLPPLWPWKVLTLPARGPRPALKGEVAVTLRLMEDVTVPSPNGFRNRLEPGASLISPPALPSPNRLRNRLEPAASLPSPPPSPSTPVSPGSLLNPSPVVTASSGHSVLFAAEPPKSGEISLAEAAAAISARRGWRHFGSEPKTTLFATKGGLVYVVTQYRLNSDTLSFVLTSGALATLDMRDLDWITTSRLNSERGVQVTLRNGVLCNGECAGN
jgi:hypothetical protein